MSSSYSPDLRIELIGTGDQAGVWGATTNNNLAYVLEQAIAGYVSVSAVSANQVLTYLDGGTAAAAANESVHASLALTTTTGANFAVYAPPASKQYTIYNASSYVATIYNSTVIGNTTAAGTGVAIPAGKTMTVWSDGTNFTQQNTHLISPTLVTPALSAATYSTTATVTAGTNTQGQGPLTSDINVVTTAAANPSGVTLPTATTGRIVTIVNKGANPINVYPATSAYIDGLSINISIQIPVNSSLQFVASSTTQWYSSATGNTGSGAVVRAVAPNLDAETYSTSAGITAAGTNQGTATALTADYNIVTTVSSNQGVILPTATTGRRLIIINRGSNALNVYPATGAKIDNGFTNAALSLPVDGFLEFDAASATEWYSSYYTSVQNSLRSVQLLTTNWVVYESGGKLVIKYGGLIGTTVMSLDSSGNLIVAGNVTAYGSP